MQPTGDTAAPTKGPTTEPTVEPTTSAPTAAAGGRRLLRHLLVVNGSNVTTSSAAPSSVPSSAPSLSPTVYTIYDLEIEFTVTVLDKSESDAVYESIKSYTFFSEYKQSL